MPRRRTPFTPYRQATAAAAGRVQLAGAAAAEALAGAEATPGGLGDGAELPSPVELPTFV